VTGFGDRVDADGGAGGMPARPGSVRAGSGNRPTGRRSAKERADGGRADKERAYLIAVDIGGDGGWTAGESLHELASLVETAGAEVVGSCEQHRESIHPVWYLGSGKAEELREAKSCTHFTLLVADDELSPKQQRSLERLLDVKVLDRSGVILDIFAQRAHTHEGRIQVELAQLEYQLPRLTRLWTHLSRTGGGIGTRGPGETQLETDRRVIRQRIKKTRERVEEVRRRRETAARARGRRLLPTVAIVGYTNAGKSTLLNALVGEEAAAAEDMLFATLDPTTRRVRLGEGQTAIVSDTVGFIHKLPHQLVEAFQATLEEVTRADALLEVVDLADRHAAEHRRTVQTVLDELGAGHKPRIVVLNKSDRVDPKEAPPPGVIRRDDLHVLRVSALTEAGMERLRAAIAEVLGDLWTEVDLPVPYAHGELLARVRERGTVNFEYRDEDVRITGKVPPSIAGELQGAARSWTMARRFREGAPHDEEGEKMGEELLTTGKIAEKLGVSPAKVSKTIKDNGLEPDQKKGNCAYFGPEKVGKLEELLKAK
jgi:GTP-binding protein HflX